MVVVGEARRSSGTPERSPRPGLPVRASLRGCLPLNCGGCRHVQAAAQLERHDKHRHQVRVGVQQHIVLQPQLRRPVAVYLVELQCNRFNFLQQRPPNVGETLR